MRSLIRLLAIVLVAGAGLAIGLAALSRPVAVAFTHGGQANLASLEQVDQPSERSYVYASDGSALAVLHAEENRSPVPFAQVPPTVVNAILDVEDEHFWVHGPVDVRSMFRAFATNARSGSVLQGGSTITQQLVKNQLLTPERNVDRKVKEAILAVQVENKMTKQQILESYLNIVYFGNGAYGVQAAAETYFATGVKELNPGQAAFLAGIISNPVGLDPVQNPKAATDRRNVALDRMVANGHLGEAEAAQWKQTPVPSAVRQPLPENDGYFVEEVKKELLDDVRLGDTPTERYNAVFRGGLRIFTNADPKMQQAAEQQVRSGIPANSQGVTAALVALDPGGRVRAVVGGPGFDQYKFNLATQGYRQPGSSFKLFSLLAMLEAGYGPDSTVNGTGPCVVHFKGFPDEPRKNSESNEGGTMTVAKATALSLNCAYLRIGATIGLDKVASMARRLGVGNDPGHPVEEVPSMVIGSEEATPLQMAAAYATIADEGIYHAPSFIDHVEDRTGKVLFKVGDPGHRVLDANIARIATGVLEGVIQKGTGTAARLDRPAAGKTGTTDEFTNAWFVGYTPQLTTSVWVGSPAGNIPMRNVGGIRVFGGTYPAAIWQGFMSDALAGLPVVDFTPPNKDAIPKSTYIQGVPGNAHGANDRKSPRSTGTPSISTPTSSPPTSSPPPPPPTTAATTAPPPKPGGKPTPTTKPPKSP